MKELGGTIIKGVKGQKAVDYILNISPKELLTVKNVMTEEKSQVSV